MADNEWMTLLASLLGGGSEILGAILQNERAKELNEQGQERFEWGKQGMESLLAERQTAYNNVWKMIYGGVGNFDFDSMQPPSGVSISSSPRKTSSSTTDSDVRANENEDKNTDHGESSEDVRGSDQSGRANDQISEDSSHGPNPNEGPGSNNVLKSDTQMSLSRRKYRRR